MKRLQWKNLVRYGGVGCAIIGATTVAAKFFENEKNSNSGPLGFPSKAVCSNTNQNPNDTKDTILDKQRSTNISVSGDFLTVKSRKNGVRIIPDATYELTPNGNSTLGDTIEKASALCQRVCEKYGLPGLAVGVSVNGKLVWEQGYGYSDIENSVPMSPRVVMRIASISKSMTMAMMGKLMDQGLIDLDVPIQTYLPQFPIKYVDGKQVNITTRHLVSHLSGIRHYTKKGAKTEMNEKEMELMEYFIKDHYDSVEKSLELFQNDELFHEPGTKFMYSTFGWTVVSAIIEKIVKIPFDKYCKITFATMWGLKNTYLDEYTPIIYNRSHYYTRSKDGILTNSPYIDASYKWAGGGFLSNTTDLMQFAHMLLYSFQCKKKHDNKNIPYLSKDTIQKLWTGHPRAIRMYLGAPNDKLYGMGFEVCDTLQKCVYCKTEDLVTVSHTGAAVGASSVLLVKFPKLYEITDNAAECNANGGKEETIKGITVVMLTNLTDVSLSATANEIGNLFKQFL